MEDNQLLLRKAAILIASLDRQTADALLEQMAAEQAARVRGAVMQLTDVSPEEEHQVIEAFLQGGGAAVDDDSWSPQDAFLEQAANPVEDDAPTPVESDVPFQFLNQTDTDALVLVLGREHPQTIALVLSHLRPERAAELVARLSARQQVDVLRRLAELDATGAESLRMVKADVEALLRNKLAAGPPTSGVAAVKEILLAASRADRREIEANVIAMDQRLAGCLGAWRRGLQNADLAFSKTDVPSAFQIPAEGQPHSGDRQSARLATQSGSAAASSQGQQTSKSQQTSSEREDPPELTFDDLERLDDRSWCVILRAADHETALLALAGASDRFVDRILRHLRYAEGRRFRRDLQQLGPLRLRDIEQAQRRLARLAAQLLAQGFLDPPSPGRFAIAA